MRVTIIIVGVVVLFLLVSKGEIFSAYDGKQESIIPRQDYNIQQETDTSHVFVSSEYDLSNTKHYFSKDKP